MEVSIYHIGELYLYDYYCNEGEYELSSTDKASEYFEKGRALEGKEDYAGALMEYKSAHEENPVRYDIYSGMIRCFKHAENLDEIERLSEESYKFACTRSELADYYRNRAFIFLQRFKPDMAAALYSYSRLICDSELAKSEIRYLEKAMGRKMEEKDTAVLLKILEEEGIPTAADNVSMALLVKAADEAAEKGVYGQALDCLEMVYDLTEDEGVMAKMETVKARMGTGDKV